MLRAKNCNETPGFIQEHITMIGQWYLFLAEKLPMSVVSLFQMVEMVMDGIEDLG